MNARRKVGTILAGALLAATTLGSFQTASAGGAAEGANPNLLNNGALMPTTQGWAKVGTGTFASAHFLGATLTNTKVTMDESTVVGYQCLNLPSALTYTLDGSLKVAPEQGRSGEAYVIASYYKEPGCAAPNIDSHESARFAETDGWVDLTMHLSRSNTQKAKSMGIVLVVDKNSTNRFLFKDKSFGAQFKNFSLRANSGGGGVTCVAFGGACGADDDEPGGQVACTDSDCAASDGTGTTTPPAQDPVPADAGDDPAPAGPALPGEALAPVDDGEEPGDGSGDAPSGAEAEETPGDAPTGDAPTGSDGAVGDDTPASAGDAPAQPSGNGAPSPQGNSGGPSKPAKPTLQPQGPGPINAVTPTPGAPATGGDSSDDPADSLSGGPGESDQAVGLGGDADNDEPASALPLMLAGLLGASGLGLILAFAFRRRSHR